MRLIKGDGIKGNQTTNKAGTQRQPRITKAGAGAVAHIHRRREG